MSGSVEQHGDSPEGGAPGIDEDARHQLAALRADVERLMRERAAPAAGDVPDAIDELMSGFDVRLAEVNRRLDRVLERRR